MGVGAAEPRNIAGMAALAARYDGFVVDQWGVLHDGAAPYGGVVDALRRLRAAGKPVVVLSNSGRRAAGNVASMTALGLGADLYDAVITSGEAAWRLMAARDDPFFAALGARCVLISRNNDRSVVDGLALDIVARPEVADFVLLSGTDAPRRAMDDYMPLLEAALARDLPLLCANPDLVGVTPDGLIANAGALAARYRALGGLVREIGKPHPEVYDMCRREIGGLAASRLCAVGDSLAHDIAGGRAAGMATALVAGGIHADVFADPNQAQARLAALVDKYGAAPDWVTPAFVWGDVP